MFASSNKFRCVDLLQTMKTLYANPVQKALFDSIYKIDFDAVKSRFETYIQAKISEVETFIPTFNAQSLLEQIQNEAELKLLLKEVKGFQIRKYPGLLQKMKQDLELKRLIFDSLKNFETKFSRIHISELASDLNEPIKKIEPLLLALIDRPDVDVVYDPESKGIVFHPTKTNRSGDQSLGSPFEIPPTFVNSTTDPTELTFESKTYRILSEIGRGGMGIVYLAQETGSKQKIIVKQLMSDRYLKDDTGCNSCEEYWQREQQIIRKQSQLHDHTMHLIGAVRTTHGAVVTYYLLLEYITGKSLDVWIKQFTKLPSPQQLSDAIVHIILPLCSHLHRVHELGIVHRDITPKNIIIQGSKTRYFPILIDWGIARELDPTEMFHPPKPYFTQTRTLATGVHSVGNPPEVIGGYKPIAASDMYMIGHILYYLCTNGHYVILPKTIEEYTLHPRNHNSFVPASLNTLVEHLTQYEPADRPPNFAWIHHELSQIVAEMQHVDLPKDTYFENSSHSQAPKDSELHKEIAALKKELGFR